MGSSQELVEEFKQRMKDAFEMTDLVMLSYFLALKVMQNKNGIFVSHHRYARDLLKHFDILHCKGVDTPMNSRVKFQLKDSSGDADMKK